MNVVPTMRAWWHDRQRPAAARALSPAAAGVSMRWRALGEFFRYHGVLAPGVRLLRELPIRAKIFVVAVAFVLPLALITTQDVLNTAQQIASSRAQIRSAEH
jgi:hypothetical protein